MKFANHSPRRRQVHFSIFFIMVFFVIQVLIMIREASITERQWEEMDALAKEERNSSCGLSMTGVSQSMQRQFFQKDNMFALCFPRFRNREADRAQMHISFKALREEFLLERSLDDPFDPATADQRVESDFNFGRYLSLAQARTISRIVEVDLKTWLFFGIIIVVFFGICLLVGRNIEVSVSPFLSVFFFTFD